jgi:hypothetical protein
MSIGKWHVLAGTLALTLASGDASHAQSGDGDGGFVGSWMGTATASTVPLPPLLTMLTFTRDGNVIEAHRPYLPPTISPLGSLVLSAGHGQWARTGDHQFAVTIAIIYEGAADNPNLAGQVALLEKVRFQVAYDPRHDTLSGTLLDELRDPAGNLVFSGPGTFTATRIAVEPLP